MIQVLLQYLKLARNFVRQFIGWWQAIRTPPCPSGLSLLKTLKPGGKNSLHYLCDTEAIACQLILANHQTLIVCTFYRPLSRPLKSVTNLCDFVRNIIDQYSDSPIWIAGDLNLPNINWETSHISSSVYPSNLCNTVLVPGYGFTQAVNFATRGNNILGIFLQTNHL